MNLKKIIFFIGGLLIIGALINWAGAQGIAEILRNTDLRYLLLAVLIYVLTLAAWAMRWKVLLKALYINAPFLAVFKAIFVGMFFNNISPGAKGLGEFIRVYYLAKETKHVMTEHRVSYAVLKQRYQWSYRGFLNATHFYQHVRRQAEKSLKQKLTAKLEY